MRCDSVKFPEVGRIQDRFALWKFIGRLYDAIGVALELESAVESARGLRRKVSYGGTCIVRGKWHAPEEVPHVFIIYRSRNPLKKQSLN
jgi:hypothetical protein